MNGSTLDIAEGLPAGEYKVVLRASNVAGSYMFTFTLNVVEKVYYIDIPRSITGGTIVSHTSSANPFLAVAGQTVTLTVTPDEGYKLETISIVNYNNSLISVPLLGTGLTRTFVMPAHHVSVVASFQPTGNVSIVETDNYPSLKAYAQNGILYVSGLKAGEKWNIYNMLGTLIYIATADGNNAEITLPARGIYIVTNGTNAVKVVY